MRSIPLTVVNGGINRLRTKGAARPDSLYDLVNAYVTAAKTIKPRPGTVRVAELPEGTKGLCAHQGKLHVFATQPVEVPEGFVCHVLTHPQSDNEEVVPLKRIHFAKPFLGFLYVVAEFDDTPLESGPIEETIYHFWLQTGGAWESETYYRHGDIVEPTTPNGLAYQAERLGAANPSWAPLVPRTMGDVIEPTVYNDFYYTVVETIGANPTSGTVEPNWPEEPGARVFEDTEGFTDSQPVTTQPPSGAKPASNVTSRYSLED